MTTDPRALRHKLSAAAGICVSVVLLFLTFRGIDFSEIQRSLRGVTWWPLALCVPVQALSFWLAALRSRELLRPVGPYRVRDTFRAFLAYFVANNVLPLRLGEVVRADLLARYGRATFTSSAAVLGVERVLDLMFLGGLFLLVVPFSSGRLSTGQVVPVLLVVLVVVIAASVWAVRNESAATGFAARLARPFGATAQGLISGLTSQIFTGLASLRSARDIAASLGLTLLYWGSMVVNVYLWFFAFDLDLPWVAAPAVLLFVSLGHLIPSAPSGVGTYHFFCVAGLELFGVGEATAVSVALVGHALAVVPLTVLAIPFVYPFVRSAWRRRETSLSTPPGKLESVS
jgi:uncharacterized protein (TIRG00374 family)